MKKTLKYKSLDGLRSVSCIGIVLMHVLTNISYDLKSFTLTNIIQSFTQFVYLFMIISSFSMCCGYYEKIKNNKITLEEFYINRIKKIIPFFTILVIIETLYHHSLTSFIEGFANITMFFGFLPKELSVAGVGWFLGLIFIFYMIFPFFVFLFSNKKRAFIVTIISFIMNFISVLYFNIKRSNMFYSFVYFCIGGLIYLYKDQIVSNIRKRKLMYFLLILTTIVCYYVIPQNKYIFNTEMIIIFGLLTCYSISIDSKILNNKFMEFVSKLSMEIYLSHMFIFRLIEKLNLTKITNNNYISYIITCCLVFGCSIIFSKIMNNVLEKIKIINCRGVVLCQKKN